MRETDVIIIETTGYNEEELFRLLPDELFFQISSGEKVVIKPNWLRDSHLYKKDEWIQVITHPAVITAVLRKVLLRLAGSGSVLITDGPETAASFHKIMAHYPVKRWVSMGIEYGIPVSILDLREEEWTDDGNVVVERKILRGDPLGSTETNLKDDSSEFFGKVPRNGYFGADSDIKETNQAHNGSDNLYRISRSVAEADVFINIPKLKTHKKSGITCNLKNLVGINTYRNFLPHNSIGTTSDGGDQFPESGTKKTLESKLMPFIHQKILIKPGLSRLFSPVISLGKKIFGDNSKTIRGGSWYGNDTLWRTILDINKVLFYASADGKMTNPTSFSKKKYISVVDAIVAGDGEGPKAPEYFKMGYIICGTNPVSVDVLAATLMGFDPDKIPSLRNSFNIRKFKLAEFEMEDILARFKGGSYSLKEIPENYIRHFKPSKGWLGYIELTDR